MTRVILLFFLLSVFLFPSIASAHVVVKPGEVGIGQFETFTVAVPVEKDNPTIELRLVIPEGLAHVTPNVKPGWNIEVKKDSTEEDGRVTEIVWSGGFIPVGQREEFLFSAQSPTNPTRIAWRAYQTYSDGTTVSWDQSPETEGDDTATPYSETLVFDDLTTAEETTSPDVTTPSNSLPLIFSVIAVIFSAAAFGLQIKGKK